MGLKASTFTETGSSYVKSDDVKAGPQKFVIQSVEAAETPDGKPALQLIFQGGKKLTLNKTNARNLAGALGDDTDFWSKRPVVVSFDPNVMYAGRRVGGIRVVAQQMAAPIPTSIPAPPPAPGVSADDAFGF